MTVRTVSKVNIERVDDFRWRIPRQGGMRVDGLVFASERMIDDIRADASLEQVRNVAHLPGIVGAALAMPDIHWGYGFPIGGVAAMDAEDGVVSPGGVGYDINCGVRLLRSRWSEAEVRPRLRELVAALFRNVPTGVGARPARSQAQPRRSAARPRARGALGGRAGHGCRGGSRSLEENGCLETADAGEVSDRALERGSGQLGSLGSGNHFVEIQWVDEIYDARAAAAFGLRHGQVTVMIHSGSRGLGHQVCGRTSRACSTARRGTTSRCRIASSPARR